MCCEDLTIDYQKNGIGRLVALTVSSQELFGADPYRWSITIGTPTSGTAWFICDQVAVIGNGFQLSNTSFLLEFSRVDWGDMIGKPWSIIHSAGGVNLYVIETLVLPGGVCGDYRQQGAGKLYAPTGSGNNQSRAGLGTTATAIRQGR